jgi:4-hydroxy-tetrahydrodipicolinate synthase
VRAQVAAGVAGVITNGTTGESPTLTREERQTLLQAALEETRGSKTQVMTGTGTASTLDTIAASQAAQTTGAAALLIVTPYYNKPSQAGLLAHYRAVADAVTLPIVLYNVPGRTGVSLSSDTVAELAAHPRIRAIKEATGNLAFQSEIIEKLRAAKRELALLSGDDPTYLSFLAQGGHGIVSVASNLFPRAMVELQKTADAADWTKARALHDRYFPLFRDLFVESNPSPIKYAMARAGFCGPTLRLPLAPISARSAETLEASLRTCGIEKGMKTA